MIGSMVRDILAAWLRGYSKGLSFRGRESRRDFLSFLILHYLLFYGLSVAVIRLPDAGSTGIKLGLGLLGLATLIITLSYNVRRLHDANSSGWLCAFYLVAMAPVVILVSLLMAPPVHEGNRYGADPRHTRYRRQRQPRRLG
ncbi:DUF805 domain-containing protein [Dyella sp.]|uniref:DUF805 domain-containing protein n=1 Tax=Dyella sp. TaxID=1869338 RepID=UPI002B45CFD8|nr:DUF805 domain-containing protein [Dyella sp.]HKT26768.1 DUF805 domain-containing protein [Dyella sp.]